MLVKLMAALGIILMLALHNIPTHPNNFLTTLNTDASRQELQLQGLELERQIIIWYHFHNSTFPPATENGSLSVSILKQMGLNPALSQKISYSYNNDKPSFTLQLALGNSHPWLSPHSGLALEK